MAVFLTWLMGALVLFGSLMFLLVRNNEHHDSDLIVWAVVWAVIWPLSFPFMLLGSMFYGVYKFVVKIADRKD